MRCRLPLLLALAALAVLSPASVRAQAPRALVDGAEAPGLTAVVALLDGAGALVCSGVLIRPHVVLTAAHCVSRVAGEPSVVFVQGDVSEAQTAYPVAMWERHPDYFAPLFDNDLALLALGTPPPAVPASLASQSPDSWVGASLRVVGYGCTDLDTEQGAGLRRVKTDAVQLLTDTGKLRHGESTCRGDSGGPLLTMEGQVVAISSSGGNDGQEFALAIPVGAHIDWLMARSEELEREVSSPGTALGGCTVGLGQPMWSWVGLCALLFIRRCDTRGLL